jgi:uncharacterized protein (DUF488 family)
MSNSIQLYTIGFTQKSAQDFFGLLAANQIQVLVDIRLKPNSQLGGFAKQRDLPYFLQSLINCDYVHNLDMAPTADLLGDYRHDGDWGHYERGFTRLLNERALITTLDRHWWESHRTCLLCSEHEPDFCHRRLVAEYLASHWKTIDIHHLM